MRRIALHSAVPIWQSKRLSQGGARGEGKGQLRGLAGRPRGRRLQCRTSSWPRSRHPLVIADGAEAKVRDRCPCRCPRRSSKPSAHAGHPSRAPKPSAQAERPSRAPKRALGTPVPGSPPAPRNDASMMLFNAVGAAPTWRWTSVLDPTSLGLGAEVRTGAASCSRSKRQPNAGVPFSPSAHSGKGSFQRLPRRCSAVVSSKPASDPRLSGRKALAR